MLHQTVIDRKFNGFRDLSIDELETVSGGVVSFTDGTAQTHNNKHLKSDSGFDATLGNPNDTVFLAWGSDGAEGGYGEGSGSSEGEYQGEIVVTPGEMERQWINGERVWVVLNHNDLTAGGLGTFVEYEVAETNAFGFPTDFYPVGTGTFHSEQSTAWSIELPFVSIPVTDREYILVRDPE